MSNSVVDVTDSTFEAEVKNSAVPVVVDFWAPWCGPCRMVAPVVEELAGEMVGKVKFCKVNVDENQAIASQFGIMSIPSLLMFKGGALVNQHVGALSKAALKGMVEKGL